MRKRLETPWAIRPEAVPTVVRLITRDMLGAHHSAPIGIGKEDGRAVLVGGSYWEAAKPSVQGKGGNKTAIIPIQGVLTNDGPAYYGSNYQTIANAAEKAASDPDVKRIVLHVDSPGGEVTGLPETATLLSQVARVKPVSAIVEGSAASAAYWLTSQASDITVTPSGEVGSVGVRMMHVDMSKMLEAEGYTVTELHSGDFKTEWSPYKPLSKEAKATMQTRLDASHQDFLDAIARGRGRRVTQTMKNARYGEGRMHSAKDALAGGLVDKIQPARDFYSGGATGALARTGPGFNALARLDLERMRAR